MCGNDPFMNINKAANKRNTDKNIKNLIEFRNTFGNRIKYRITQSANAFPSGIIAFKMVHIITPVIWCTASYVLFELIYRYYFIWQFFAANQLLDRLSPYLDSNCMLCIRET